jgi:RND family efflux transporter MFP subunit
MAKKTRFLKAARLIPGPGLLALLTLSPSLTGGPAVASDGQPPASAASAGPAAPAGGSPPAATNWAPRPASPPGADAAPSPATGGAPGASPPLRTHRATVGCLIAPDRSADIGSAVTGVVSAIRVDRGDTVRQGQPLVLLAQDIERANLKAVAARHEIEADVRSAESNVALAKERHQRLAGLVDSGAVAALTVEQAKAEFEVARERLQQARGQRQVLQQEMGVAQAQLAQRTLRAPFDGVVVERLSHEGERVEDRPLLRLAKLDPLRVELVMPASRWDSVRSGDTLGLLPELPGATRVAAKVTHVDRTIDAASNTFRVRLSLPNPGHRIPAGARCRLEGPLEASTKPEAAGKPDVAATNGAGTALRPVAALPRDGGVTPAAAAGPVPAAAVAAGQGPASAAPPAATPPELPRVPPAEATARRPAPPVSETVQWPDGAVHTHRQAAAAPSATRSPAAAAPATAAAPPAAATGGGTGASPAAADPPVPPRWVATTAGTGPAAATPGPAAPVPVPGSTPAAAPRPAPVPAPAGPSGRPPA